MADTATQNTTTLPPPAPTVKFAVVQTGGVTPESEIVVFKDDSGKRTPIIISLWDDEHKAQRMAKRILTRFGKMRAFEKDGVYLLQPIVGVLRLSMEATQKRGQRKAKESTNGDGKTKSLETKIIDHARGHGKPVGAK